MRIQKFLSQQGILSRRHAEKALISGQIKVNNKTVTTLGIQIDPEKDIIKYNNKIIKSGKNDYIYIALNKPIDVVCTAKKFKGEKNIFDLVTTTTKLFPVGRLDKNSSGLILLTNDGDVANEIAHPKYFCEKEYVIKVHRPLTDNILKNFIKGAVVEGVKYRIIKFKLQNKYTVNVVLKEGKKRHLRKLFNHANYNILKLERIRIKNLKLGKLPLGKYRNLTTQEIDDLHVKNI